MSFHWLSLLSHIPISNSEPPKMLCIICTWLMLNKCYMACCYPHPPSMLLKRIGTRKTTSLGPEDSVVCYHHTLCMKKYTNAKYNKHSCTRWEFISMTQEITHFAGTDQVLWSFESRLKSIAHYHHIYNALETYTLIGRSVFSYAWKLYLKG